MALSDWLAHPIDSATNAISSWLQWAGRKVAQGAGQTVGLNLGGDSSSAPAVTPGATATAAPPQYGDKYAFTGKEAPDDAPPSIGQGLKAMFLGNAGKGQMNLGSKLAIGAAAIFGLAALGLSTPIAIIGGLLLAMFAPQLGGMLSGLLGKAGSLFGGHGGSSPSAEAGGSPAQGQGVSAPAQGSFMAQAMNWVGNVKDTVVNDADIAISRGKVFASTHLNSDAKLKAMNAIDFFKEKGWSEAQATGIAANLMKESGFKLDAAGDATSGVAHAHGLAQWQAPRLKAFEALYGHSLTDKSIPEGQRWIEQLSFVDHELTHSEKAAGDALRLAKTPEDSARVVSFLFERPANKTQEPLQRAAIATQLAAARTGIVEDTHLASAKPADPVRVAAASANITAGHNMVQEVPAKTTGADTPESAAAAMRNAVSGNATVVTDAGVQTLPQNVALANTNKHAVGA